MLAPLSDRDKIKSFLKEETEDVCEMLDCVDDILALHHTNTCCGVKVRIFVELVD